MGKSTPLYNFLITPKPFEDELLSSWLARAAFAHQMSLSSFLNFYVIKNRHSIDRRDIDFYLNEDFFSVLSMKSRLSISEIKRMSLRHYEGRLFVCNDCIYPPKPIRLLMDKRTHFGMMFCPKCLEEDETPYFRQKWRFSFYNACAEHKILLLDRCDDCGSRINLIRTRPNQHIAYCYKCQNDLRQLSAPIHITDSEAEAIELLESGLARGYLSIGGEKVLPAMFFTVYSHLKILLDTGQSLALPNFPEIETYKQIYKKYECNKSSALLVRKNALLNAMVVHLFDDFPRNLTSFANDNKFTHRDFVHDIQYEPFWYRYMVDEFVPKIDTVGRLISESEVVGAIRYLRQLGGVVNQKNVAEVLGCHLTIHKHYVQIYQQLNISNDQGR